MIPPGSMGNPLSVQTACWAVGGGFGGGEVGMVQIGWHASQASGHVAQASASSQSGKGHGADPQDAVRAALATVPIVAGQNPRERLRGEIQHDLGEESLGTRHTKSTQGTSGGIQTLPKRRFG